MSRNEKAFIYASIDLHAENEKKNIAKAKKGKKR